MSANNQNLDTQGLFENPTTEETIVFYVTLVINLLTVLVLGYALCFRNYPPMKAQHVGISVILGLGGIIYCISNTITQGMATYKGFLGVCDFWGVWAMFTLGIGVLMSAINMRLILFYRIFITGKSFKPGYSRVIGFLRKFWPFFVMWSPTIVTSIVINSLTGQRGAWLVEYHGMRACLYSNEYMYWAFVYLGIMFVVSWILYFRMRKVAKAFNGFKMAIWTLIIFTSVLVINTVIVFTDGFNQPWGRILSAISNTVLITTYIMLIFASPVFGHMFRREQTMRHFMNNLHKDAMIAKQVRQPGFLQEDLLASSSLEKLRQDMYNNQEAKHFRRYKKERNMGSVYSSTVEYDNTPYMGVARAAQQPQFPTQAEITYSENIKRVL